MTFSMTVQADRLQSALDPVTALVSEAKIRTGEDGLSITAVDPANVGMVDMELSAGACATYIQTMNATMQRTLLLSAFLLVVAILADVRASTDDSDTEGRR